MNINTPENTNVQETKDQIANQYGVGDFEQIDRGKVTSRANGNITRTLVELAENQLAQEQQWKQQQQQWKQQHQQQLK